MYWSREVGNIFIRSASCVANSVNSLWSLRTRHYLSGLRESPPFESWWRFVRCLEVTAVKCLIQMTDDGNRCPLTRCMDSRLYCEYCIGVENCGLVERMAEIIHKKELKSFTRNNKMFFFAQI